MVNRRMYHEIKKMQKSGYGKKRISRELGVDKKTVIKYWNMDETEYRQYLNKVRYREKDFELFRENILEIYRVNEYLKIPVSAVYDYLEESEGTMPANENSLRNYIHYLEESDQLKIKRQLRIYSQVDELPYGKQVQIDFGVKPNHRGGKYYIFAAVLSASRFKYAALQEKPFTAMDLIGHLLDCFEYFRGMPEELVIDQDSIMVVNENSGEIIYTKQFGDFIEEMELKMWVCRKADPESKGKIENFIKYIKYNFFAVREFENITQSKESLISWLERRANGKISQATRKIPLIEIETERRFLKPLRHSIYRKEHHSGREERRVNDKCRIAVDASQYDLPDRYRNQVVEVFKSRDMLFVFDRYTGKEITAYPLSLLPGKILKNRAIIRESGIKLKELKTEVLEYFPLLNWKTFLEANWSAYQRYVRDQCIEARRFFRDGEIDHDALDEALHFCLENNMVSIGNLKESYKYYIAQIKESKEQTPATAVSIYSIKRPVTPGLEVAKPDLGLYQCLISSEGGEQ
jgi:hypothetical protein